MKPENTAENKEIASRYRQLLRVSKWSREKGDISIIRKAFDLALEAHKPQRRKSGEPYIYHPIAVAKIAAEEIGLGTTSIVCALLHDVVEDTDITLEDIEAGFGPKVANIIDGLTKISGVFDTNSPFSNYFNANNDKQNSFDARGADAGVEARLQARLEILKLETVEQAVNAVQTKANKGGQFSKDVGRRK